MQYTKTRRSISLAICALTIACVITRARHTAAADSKPTSHPNVLFIAVDDLNDWVGCLKGHPQALTPNIDRLAARGMLFANAHCAAPACNPSRAAVSSGLMPNLTKVWSNDSGSMSKVFPSALQMPTAFKTAGYFAAGTGKLFHKKANAEFHEFQSYEQRWSPFTREAVDYKKHELPSKSTGAPRHVLKDIFGREVVLPMNGMPSDRRPKEKSGESFDWGGFDLPDAQWGDTLSTDWMVRQIEKERDQPVFLGIGYYRPHIPLFAPQRFFERFQTNPGKLPPYRADDLDDLSELGRKWAIEPVTAGLHATVVKHNQWRTAVEAYLACVTYVDHEIGRVVDSLDASDIAGNTMIVLWSDHGWQLGEKDHWGKWTGWERSTKVPLIIVPPRDQSRHFATAGSVCEQPVGLIDLFPTFAELCNIERPSVLHGNSLAPLLRNPDAEFRKTTLTMFDEGNASVRDTNWRYLQYSDGSEELYDIKRDPNEWENLANDVRHAKVKEMLKSQLQQHLTRVATSRE